MFLGFRNGLETVDGGQDQGVNLVKERLPSIFHPWLNQLNGLPTVHTCTPSSEQTPESKPPLPVLLNAHDLSCDRTVILGVGQVNIYPTRVDVSGGTHFTTKQ